MVTATSPGTRASRAMWLWLWRLGRRTRGRWDRRIYGWLDGIKVLLVTATSPGSGHALFLRIQLRTRPSPQFRLIWRVRSRLRLRWFEGVVLELYLAHHTGQPTRRGSPACSVVSRVPGRPAASHPLPRPCPVEAAVSRMHGVVTAKSRVECSLVIGCSGCLALLLLRRC